MKEARSVEVEVLPPEGISTQSTQPSLKDDPFVRLMSKLMDTVFVIPGTNIRFGLDPILGLLPGVGDTASALISTFLVSQSVRYGVPKVVSIRMALNILINTVVGAIPFVGDAFSIWFKSNIRNYELLQKHANMSHDSTKGDWVFVICLIGLLMGIVVLIAITLVVVIEKLWNSL